MALVKHPLEDGWTFRQSDSTATGDWLPVKRVPTQVHMDLVANNKISDPFIDLNELAARWVNEKDWSYRVQFKKPAGPSISSPFITDLVFEGLDTFATVFLNGHEILKSDNMFLTHRVNISTLLKNDNILEIKFDSAFLKGRELVKEHEHEHTFYVRQTDIGRVPTRKAQYNWGWDWGPILMTAGPWRPVYLEQYVSKIDDVWAQYEVSKDLKTSSGQIFAKIVGANSKPVNLTISLGGTIIWEKAAAVDNNGLAKADFQVDNPELWYPHGYGSQVLYELKAILTSSDEKSKLVGFRRVELIQEKDEFGKSFYFRINQIDIFSGGSCWIPADSLLSQIPAQRYHDWMKLMVEGNQIMLRIWGGGIYEDDALFDACDRLGVLVWHDFQFACASYPTYPSYLESVEQEARQNIRRLKSHPSLVIWAGNNEDYQVQERYHLHYDYDGDKDPQSWLKSTFPARYIYEYLLPNIVKEEDPFMVYHPSSPWGDGKRTTDKTVGDIHQWNIWHGRMNRYQETHLLSGRFISEFGMEAYPHLETIRGMIQDPQQQHPGSMMMDFRNKAIDHERRMVTYVAENFLVKYDLPSYTHLTQVVQAETMHFAYKTWRREWGTPGARKCGGILVWQLNDCWPTMSWAVVDYYLVKKPSFYAMANALKPLAVGISQPYHNWTEGHADPTLPARDTKFDLWVASSRLDSVPVEIIVRFISVRTGQEVHPSLKLGGITVLPNSTTEVLKDHSLPVTNPQFNDTTQPFDLVKYDPYVIHATIKDGDEVVSIDTSWPQPIKYLDLSNRNVTFKAVSTNQISISAARPVKGFVFEETRAMKLSDNGIDLVPGEERVVDVTGASLDSLRYTYIGAPEGSLKVAVSIPDDLVSKARL
ncbi:glycoside hydrolase family 2 protein [Annulohypoxylon maeteangense]|uniref:glycoside hydrolase family 2 protein n=1 Tax=Annulohypoxylon maeteangense TaxID=1927788 RepID=UPI002007526D|nr:glycoside hydrolase family 2 protein [Annulohypoxylon maeteangense]KAI0885015.1 glycoside hydrolase family 2 protein [Annulohypoxylon maeteangense]